MEDDDICPYKRLLLGSDVDLIEIGVELFEIADLYIRCGLEYLKDSLTSVALLVVGVRINNEYFHSS